MEPAESSPTEDFTRRLPGEILSLIFFMTVLLRDKDDPYPPLHTRGSARLALVCRRWRAVALDQSELWSRIHLHWPLGLADLYYERAGPVVPLSFYYCEAYVRTRSPQGHRRFLPDNNFHGPLPSSLVNIVAGMDANNSERFCFMQTWEATPVRLLTYPNTLSRTRVINIAAHTFSYEREGYIDAHIGFSAKMIIQSSALPALQSMAFQIFESHNAHQSPYRVSEIFTSSGLRNLSFKATNLSDMTVRDRHCAPFSPSLTSLTLYNVHIHDANFHPVNLLYGLVNLKYLTLRNVTGFTKILPADAPHTALPRLRRATLYVDDAISLALLKAIELPCSLEVDVKLNLNSRSFTALLAALRARCPPPPAHFRTLDVHLPTLVVSDPSDAEALPRQFTARAEGSVPVVNFVEGIFRIAYYTEPPELSEVIRLLPACTSVVHLIVSPHIAFSHAVAGVDIWTNGLASALPTVETIETSGNAGTRLLSALLHADRDEKGPAFPHLRSLAIGVEGPLELEIEDAVRRVREQRPEIEMSFPST
ncbi:hypothetical protein K488DRAFT_82224 [Vararia minispora EC-137]|uniref:Uncharacterized protein n=1 Tax=Vararia minispora EC-137 TaxID=1314806 RepID=A0ACB8QYD6_9AGAM|nr:hypothetical protein K488DRAFT_82224 [Vararia minispora EC-137]